jgi:HPt (histidine-containing phosphotransfer) domain-containing protein
VAASLRQSFTPQPSLVDPEIFDIAHFERQTFGDALLQREIIVLLMAQVEDARKAFAAPMTSTSWRFLTHTLKGAAAAVGAVRLADIAGKWELEGTPNNEAARAAIVSTFAAEAALLADAVAAYQA